jgi:hypothetical protein
MKTTLFGLAAQAADFSMLCVDAPSSVGMLFLFDGKEKKAEDFYFS